MISNYPVMCSTVRGHTKSVGCYTGLTPVLACWDLISSRVGLSNPDQRSSTFVLDFRQHRPSSNAALLTRSAFCLIGVFVLFVSCSPFFSDFFFDICLELFFFKCASGVSGASFEHRTYSLNRELTWCVRAKGGGGGSLLVFSLHIPPPESANLGVN